MHRSIAAVAAATTLAAAPAVAAEATPTTFDQRVALEYQTWSWASPGGARLDYSTPMTVFTVTDHTGAILGAATTVAGNEARRRAAERDAIRKGESRYTYEHHEGRALSGTRFSFVVGAGSVGGATTAGGATALGASPSALHSRIGLEGDLFELFGGVLVFEASTAYWLVRSSAGAAGTAPQNVQAWNWPLGLRWRFTPKFLKGLVIEPGASFDWLYTAYYAVNGGARWDARNLGIEAGWYVLPSLKLRAGYGLYRLPHEDVGWMKREDVVDLKNLSLGVTANF